MKEIIPLWTLAGKPDMINDTQGKCVICAQESEGQDYWQWVRPTFMDHDKVGDGTIICCGCQYLFTYYSLELQSMTGKDKPQRMLNYSHFVLNDTWYAYNKGQKREMRDILLRELDYAVIADSGQKHLLFRARRRWIQFEEQRAPMNISLLVNTMSCIDELYRYFSKDEIRTGHYSQHRIRLCGLSEFIQLARQADAMRGSLYFDIALFLAYQGDYETRTGTGTNEGMGSREASLPVVDGDRCSIQEQLSF